MPRALTEQEKCAQYQKLLEKGKAVVMAYGMRKVSVDDIAKAAGLAKGTFYQHFESKEKYLYALVEAMHRDVFLQAERMISDGVFDGDNPRESTHAFLQKLFALPELVFYVQNELDIASILEAIPSDTMQSFKLMEKSLFRDILHLLGVDTGVVKPGVVHNFVHTLFLLQSSEYMAKDDVPQTIGLIMDSLISYVFGDAQ